LAKSPEQAHLNANSVLRGPTMLEFPFWVLSTIVVVALLTQCALWGRLPTLSEFQLWVLSTMVLLALVVVCVMLPVRAWDGHP
jgi:hypothetical protein